MKMRLTRSLPRRGPRGPRGSLPCETGRGVEATEVTDLLSGPTRAAVAGVVAAAAVLLSAASAFGATAQSFTTPGESSFVVPAGVTQVAVDMAGGQGGGGLVANCQGGAGARITGVIHVTPGQKLYVEVGGAGGDETNGKSAAGGYNGGGAGSEESWASGGGGGASDLRTQPASSGLGSDPRILVAGGGGGGGGFDRSCKAGAGGLVPTAGGNGGFGSTAGQPGTQSAGGARGVSGSCGASLPTPSTDGRLGQGGTGAWTRTSAPGALCIGSGGGGGGGRYGGGGGGASQLDADFNTGSVGGGAGGGAGSNLIPSSVANVTVVTAAKSKVSPMNGAVTLDWTPGPPTATIASPAGGGTYAVDQHVATSFSCADGLNGSGLASCVDGGGAASPGVLDTATPGAHTYTVTATSKSGQTGTKTINYTVAAAPTATIAAPAGGGTYAVGEQVATSFSCAPGTGGPALTSCRDGAGAPSPGVLDTATPGAHTYTVTATAGDGQTGTKSITYTVSAAPSATIAAPAGGGTYAVGEDVATSFSCAPGASGAALTSCRDGAGAASPGVLDTATPGTHTYTVTATGGDGQTGTKSITYTVAAAPTATIAAPADGGSYAVGEHVATTFSCAEGASGPGIESCAGAAALDTATAGAHTFKVTATSKDGQTGTASIAYTVAGAPSATVATPAGGGTYAVGEEVGTSFSCARGASGPALTSCLDGSGAASPGVLDTATPGAHTYTVTATGGDGQTGTKSINYTVAAAPKATITAPDDGGTYAVGEHVATTFSCAEGASGPGIATCDGAATLDTATAGTFIYKVTATSKDGQTGTKSINYTVAAAPSVTITAPGDGKTYAVDQHVATAFACAEGDSGPGLASCVDGDGAKSPGVLDTSKTGTFTYKVTATSKDGQTDTASITYTVAKIPTATITAPGDGETYAVGQDVATAFSCAAGENGAAIASCGDGDGDGKAGGAGHLDTHAAGDFTYTVTATGTDGLSGTATIHYTVAATSAPSGSSGASGASSGSSGAAPLVGAGAKVTPPSNRFTVTGVRPTRDGRVRFTLHLPGPGAVEVMETTETGNLAHAAVTFVPGNARFAFAGTKRLKATRAGTIIVTTTPTARGRALLAHHRWRVTVRLWVAFRPAGGTQRRVHVERVRIP
jgi:hypothetical protein